MGVYQHAVTKMINGKMYAWNGSTWVSVQTGEPYKKPAASSTIVDKPDDDFYGHDPNQIKSDYIDALLSDPFGDKSLEMPSSEELDKRASDWADGVIKSVVDPIQGIRNRNYELRDLSMRRAGEYYKAATGIATGGKEGEEGKAYAKNEYGSEHIPGVIGLMAERLMANISSDFTKQDYALADKIAEVFSKKPELMESKRNSIIEEIKGARSWAELKHSTKLQAYGILNAEINAWDKTNYDRGRTAKADAAALSAALRAEQDREELTESQRAAQWTNLALQYTKSQDKFIFGARINKKTGKWEIYQIGEKTPDQDDADYSIKYYTDGEGVKHPYLFDSDTGRAFIRQPNGKLKEIVPPDSQPKPPAPEKPSKLTYDPIDGLYNADGTKNTEWAIGSDGNYYRYIKGKWVRQSQPPKGAAPKTGASAGAGSNEGAKAKVKVSQDIGNLETYTAYFDEAVASTLIEKYPEKAVFISQNGYAKYRQEVLKLKPEIKQQFVEDLYSSNFAYLAPYFPNAKSELDKFLRTEIEKAWAKAWKRFAG